MNCIENYINGNLADAKKGAKRVSYQKLRAALVDDYGKSLTAAGAIADFLKGQGTFQAACDAEHTEKAG
jgi:hypothetical protein